MNFNNFLIIYNKVYTIKDSIRFILIAFIYALIEVFTLSCTALFIQIVSNANSSFSFISYFPTILSSLSISTYIYFFISLILLRYTTSIFYFKWVYSTIFNTQTKINSIFCELIFEQDYVQLKSEEFQSTKNVFYKELDYYLTYFIQPLLLLLPDIFQIFFLICLLLFILPHYSIIIIFLLIIAVYFINKLVKKKVVQISDKLAIHQRNRTHVIGNFYSNILFWKVKNQFQNLKSSFEIENDVIAKNSSSLNFIQQIPRTTFEFFIYIIFATFALINITNTGQIFSSYVIMSLAAIKLLPSAVKISSFIQSALSTNSIVISLNSVIKNRVYNKRGDAEVVVYNFENKFEFQNVTFKYKDKIILYKCDFIFNKGEIISLSGNSGTGKSTFIEIFLRLIEVTSGNIFLDDKDITTIPINFSRIIGIVPQSIEFINGTIKDNLLLGVNLHVTEDEINNILTKCNLIDLINKMPNGLNTKIDNQSNFFSGGEKQRIAIARTLLDKNVKILILDEITSALDKTNSINLLNNIMLFKEQYSIIFITHDELIKKYCEKNYILNNGNLKLLSE